MRRGRRALQGNIRPVRCNKSVLLYCIRLLHGVALFATRIAVLATGNFPLKLYIFRQLGRKEKIKEYFTTRFARYTHDLFKDLKNADEK